MAKPVNFDQLYPGRFLKAGLLLGKKVTLTIKDVELQELEGEDGKKKKKATLSFNESEMELVMCKTNGLCVKSMFGPTLAEWLGKRVTIFESQWNGEPCIRVWGSPDIKQDMKISVQLPRRRPMEMVMHAVKSSKPAPQTQLDPRITAAFEILEWGQDRRSEYLADNASMTQQEMAADLNRLVEEQQVEA